MKLSIPAGTTSKRIAIFIQDSSSTTGGGLTGLVFNSSSLVCYTWIDTDGNVGGTSQTLATATLGTFTSVGFKEKDATNMPGLYEFGVPNALLAAGVKWAIIMLKGATNMAPLPIEIEVTATSNQDAVRGGMTALPNANAEAAGGLYTRGSGAGQINQPANGLVDVNTLRWNGTAVATPATAGIPDVNVKNINNVSAASVTTISANQGTTQPVNFTGAGASALAKSDVLDWNSTAVTAPNTAGTPVVDVGRINNVSTAAVTTVKAVQGLTTADTIATYTGNTPQTGDTFARVGAPAGASVSADIAAINTKTTNLPASPSAVGSAMTLTAGERNSVADALLDRADAIETAWTVRKVLRIISAALGGKLSGAATATVVVRDVTDAKDRITATVDASGNRTAVTLDGT